MKRLLPFLLLGLLAACTNPPRQPVVTCLDFHTFKPGEPVKGKQWIDRFTIEANAKPLEFRDAGAAGGPSGTIGLLIKDHVFVGIDDPYTQFEITYVSNSTVPIRFETYDQAANILDRKTFATDPLHTALNVSLQEAKPTKLLGFYEGGGEGLLTKVCFVH